MEAIVRSAEEENELEVLSELIEDLGRRCAELERRREEEEEERLLMIYEWDSY